MEQENYEELEMDIIPYLPADVINASGDYTGEPVNN